MNDNFRLGSWQDGYRLSDGCKIKHGFAFKGEFMNTQDDDSLPVVVNIVNFQYTGGFRFESTKVQRYVGAYPKEYELHPGDVLLVMTCQTPKGEILGVPGRIPIDGKRYLHNQRMGLAVVQDREALDLGFLYYLFLSPQFNTHLFKTATGAKILHTAPGRIEDYRFARPPMETQRRIAAILSSYDDLIENNTRRIKLLEEMAQMIYREWFVNFRFPGHENVRLVDSELGPIPEGWSVRNLFDVAHVTYGYPFKSKLFAEGGDGIPVIRIRDIKADSTNTMTTEAADSKYIVNNGDLLVGMDGDFHMGKWAGRKAYLNQRVVRFRPKLNLPSYFLFLALQAPIHHFDTTIVGTTVAHLSDRDLRSVNLLVPADDVLEWSSAMFDPVFTLEIALKLKNANLRATRDLLLPKLISGEIPVDNARPGGADPSTLVKQNG
ncbi:MAG: restriction endonuclease subunit S [bacterium]|nr:restriction endonuclease subunit S [bacterium]